MPIPKPPPRQPALPVRAGAFEVDVVNHRLLHQGRPVPLTPKAYAVLACLLDRPGELVRKDDLFQQAWRDRVVTDAALSRVVRELRRAFGDDAQEPRFIATVHGVGLRWVGGGAAAATPGVAAPPRAWQPIVGRDAELEQLEQAWQRACRGEREVLFVSGEAGIGKTALVEAFVAQPAIAGHVAQGRCVQSHGESEPYLPWLDVLDHLARQRGTEELDAVLARHAPAWRAMLAHQALPDASTDWTPPRLRRELAQALEALARQRPLLIWLEDLHWCDPSSLDLIALLASRRDSAPLMLLASLRPAEAAAWPLSGPLATLVTTLPHRGLARELALMALPEAAVEALIERRWGPARDARDAQALAAFIHRRTEGHALFALAMLQDLEARQGVTLDAGGWTPARDFSPLDETVPDGLRRLLRWRLESLPEAERGVLSAAGVSGMTFAAAMPAAALEQALPEVEAACLALAHRGLLRVLPDVATWPDGTRSAGFGFVHALHQQAASDGVTPALRQHWQGRIARRLLQAHQGDAAALAARASELALRFEEAGDTPQALHQLRAAAAHALARCAYREAASLLRHGLVLTGRLPTGGATDPERERECEREELALRLPLGAALMASEGYAAAEVRDCYDRALALCARVGSEADWSRALRGQWNVEFLSCRLRAACATAGKLLDHAQAAADEELALDAHAKLGQTLLHMGDLAAADRHLQRVLDAARAPTGSGGPAGPIKPALRRAWPRVAAYQTWVHWYSGRAEQALRLGDQAVAAAEAGQGAHSLAFALGYVSWVRLMGGHTQAALHLAQRQRAVSEAAGLAYWEQLARFLQGAVAAREGRRPEGIATMRQAKDDMLAAGGQVGVPYLLCLLAQALIEDGDADSALEAVLDAERRMQEQGNDLYRAEAARLRRWLQRPAADRGRGLPEGWRHDSPANTAPPSTSAAAATCSDQAKPSAG